MQKPNTITLRGLIAATHTPFDAGGALNSEIIEKQAAHLLAQNVKTVFIGGTTGESHSLTLAERRVLTEGWLAVARGTALQVAVHVGSNCLADARALAAQAQALGATAIAATTPSYFKPQNLDLLISCCAEIAAGAPETPFYYYDIPMLTGVHFSMPDFLVRGSERIPTLRGLKFTNPDLMSYQLCLKAPGGFDVPWGMDECLLGALALGARGAVGSTYNFAAPLYHRLIAAFERGDLNAARVEQHRSVQMVKLLAGCGYMGAAKAVMNMLGVDVGPARLPHANPTAAQVACLRRELEQMGFFDWIAATKTK